MGQAKYQRDGDPRTSGPGFGITIHPDELETPRQWRRPRVIFVNSMSDLFHPRVPAEFIWRVFNVMSETPQHTYQVLTKRPQRARALLRSWTPVSNIWLGVSIENDEHVRRADLLRETPAAIRFLSCEPLLGPLPSLNLSNINWVIVGGESGPDFRPLEERWVLDIRDRCQSSGVPFFFNQWGGRTAKSGGRKLEHRTWDEMPALASSSLG